MSKNVNKNSKSTSKANSKLIVSIIIILCLVILTVIGVVVFIGKTEKEPDNPKKDPAVKDELTVEERGNLMNELSKIALELYQNEKYLEFPKSGTSGYYATVEELKKLGYTDVDSYLRNCTDNDSVIFFDVDHMERYPDGYPFLTICECDKISFEQK